MSWRLLLRTGAVLQDEPDQFFCHDDLVQSRNVWMLELSVMVDFAGKVRVVLIS